MKTIFLAALLLISQPIAFAEPPIHYATTAEHDGKEYFVRDNAIFWKLKGSEKDFRVPDSDAPIDTILFHKGNLVALEGNTRGSLSSFFNGGGNVWLLEKGKFRLIGDNTKQVLSNGRDLIALTHNDQIWIYNGDSESRDKTVLVQNLPVGDVNVPIVTELEGAAFHDSGLRHVKAIHKNARTGEVLVTLASGRMVSFQDLQAVGFTEAALDELYRRQERSYESGASVVEGSTRGKAGSVDASESAAATDLKSGDGI